MKQEEKFEGFDRVFPLIGGHHLYQWLLLAMASMQSMLLAFHHFGYVFLAAIPDHWCQIKELQNTNWTTEQIKNISIPRKYDSHKFEKCEYYDLGYTHLKLESYESAYEKLLQDFEQVTRIPCTKWAYDKTIYDSTTVTQFDLVCGRQFMVGTIQATYMAGAFIGSFIMSGLSDRILGRRNTVLVSVLIVLIAGFGAAFSPTYTAFVTCRLFIAIGVTGSYQNCLTLLMEYSDTSHRAILGIISSMPFAVGVMIMPIYGYFIRDWSNLQLAFTLSALLLLIYIWLLPESVRWLATKGREEEGLKIIKSIAKWNNRPEPDSAKILAILNQCKDENYGAKTGAGVRDLQCFTKTVQGVKGFLGNYLRLVRTPELRKRSIVIWILFASVAFIYYGVSFDSALLTNDPFILVFFTGLMEIPGLLGVIPFVKKWGRRPTVASTFLLAGLSIMIVSFISAEFTTLRVVLSMAGKLFISGCFGIIYVLASELYPTETRATGLGAASLMGRIGSMSAPFVVSQMKNVYTDLPSVIFGSAGILAGLIALLLPETKGEEMLESVNAIEVRVKRSHSIAVGPDCGNELRQSNFGVNDSCEDGLPKSNIKHC